MILKETVRRDGLRMISCNIPTQTRVCVSISALVGSAYDPIDRQGLFHYFEHMAFKGTKRRSVKDIRDFANRNLLSFNASTYRDRTEYWGMGIAAKMPLVCDFITDIYAHSIFPTAEIEKEKGPVLLEAARNRDDDGYLCDLTLREMLYKENPLRQFSTGTEAGIKAITRADLLREKERWYIPSNTIVLAVGRVSHAAFVREIDKRIPVKEGSVPKVSWNNELNEAPVKKAKTIARKERHKSTILMGCKIEDRVNDRMEAVEDFMTGLLVSGWSSRLWSEVREKRGLAYTATGGANRIYDLGAYFDAFVQTQPGKEKEVEALMRKALFTPITSKDKKLFEDTRESVLDRITAGYGENLGSWAGLIYDKIMKGESLSHIERYFGEQRRIVKSLSLHEMETMRRAIFKPDRFVTVIVKPDAKA